MAINHNLGQGSGMSVYEGSLSAYTEQRGEENGGKSRKAGKNTGSWCSLPNQVPLRSLAVVHMQDVAVCHYERNYCKMTRWHHSL